MLFNLVQKFSAAADAKEMKHKKKKKKKKKLHLF